MKNEQDVNAKLVEALKMVKDYFYDENIERIGLANEVYNTVESALSSLPETPSPDKALLHYLKEYKKTNK